MKNGNKSKNELGIALLFFCLFAAGTPLVFAAEPEIAAAPKEAVSEDELASTFDSAVPAKVTAISEDKSSARKEDIVIQTGDRLKIKIYPEDDYIKGGEMQVSSEGNITLQLVGKVDIAGKTAVEAEQVIAKIIDADYLVNPEVVIEVLTKTEAAKRSVIIFGQVRKPGPYDFSMEKKKMTLLEVISLAGGFTEIANVKKIKLVRKEGGQKKAVNINGEAVMSGDDPDVELQNGDVITVSESLF